MKELARSPKTRLANYCNRRMSGIGVRRGATEKQLVTAPWEIVMVQPNGIASPDLWAAKYVRNLLPVQPYGSLPL